MHGRNPRFLLRTCPLRTSLLRTSQVLILGLCCAGFATRNISAQILSAPSAQTPPISNSTQPPSVLAKQGNTGAPSPTQHLLANSNIKLGPGVSDRGRCIRRARPANQVAH